MTILMTVFVQWNNVLQFVTSNVVQFIVILLYQCWDSLCFVLVYYDGDEDDMLIVMMMIIIVILSSSSSSSPHPDMTCIVDWALKK